jgi:isochorismate hydrolase
VRKFLISDIQIYFVSFYVSIQFSMELRIENNEMRRQKSAYLAKPSKEFLFKKKTRAKLRK